jgi:PAS domain S-box-containing protein
MRLKALCECDILDTPPQPEFDAVTRLATRILKCPTAMVSLVTDDRQWFKSRVGTDLTQTPISQAICSWVVASRETLIIPDTARDERTRDNPLVTQGDRVRFYAGVPLRLSDGNVLGAFCVVDYVPRTFTPEEIEVLETLGAQAATLLDLRRTAKRAEMLESVSREKEERYRAALTGSLDSFYLFRCVRDPRGRVSDFEFIDVNERGAAMLSRTREEIVGQRLCELYPIHRTDGSFDRYLHVFESGVAIEEEFDLHLDGLKGTRFFHQVVPHADGVAIASRDITETHKAEQDRWRQQENLQIAMDAMPQRVFWKDLEGKYIGCNLAMARDAGLDSPQEIIGKSDTLLPWSKHAMAYRADDLSVMRSGTARVCYEEPYTNEAGHTMWVRTSKVPMRDKAGKVIGVIGTYEDISHEREVREELRRAKNAAEQAVRAKMLFLANMSHEIRTPMTAILGFTSILEETDSTEEHRRDCIRTIRTNGEHLLSIINDVLDLSKIESGEMRLEAIPVCLNTLVKQVTDTLRHRADAKGLTLRFVPRGIEKSHVLTDPTRLRQVLINLVGNAIKFTEQGEVCVELDTLDLAGCMTQTKLTVTDTGMGMTKQEMANLFRPFSQADESTTRRFGGTGLGLSITQRLVRLLSGELDVASAPGKGSTFTARFTFTKASSEESVKVRRDADAPAHPITAGDAGSATPPLTGVRVLLAEDGIDNQRLVSHFLRRAGATVEIAENGRIAIERITHSQERGMPFDVVLMDMQMPELDGYSATGLLRQSGYSGTIIAITAHAMAGDRERCLRAGCDDYATKPIDRDGLVAKVARAASLGRAAAPRAA